jgi:hypothetical protein
VHVRGTLGYVWCVHATFVAAIGKDSLMMKTEIYYSSMDLSSHVIIQLSTFLSRQITLVLVLVPPAMF